MKSIPPDLFLLHQLFVVEEGLAVIRHDLRNRLGSIRNANFYVRRKLQKIAPDLGTSDPRLPEFLALIAAEVDATEKIMESKLPAPEPGELVPVSTIVRRARDVTALPSSIQLIIETTSDARVRLATDEAVLAVHCLIENAIDALAAAGGTVWLRVTAQDGRVAIAVDDDAVGGFPERALEPFFTTRPGRMGIGLNIARRVAARWRGKLALAPREQGTRVELSFGIEPG
jgi:signal transduction histidine kinase